MTKAHYDYNISPEYDRAIFAKLVSLLTERIDNIKKTEYLEDPLDGDQFQILKTPYGDIKVINDFTVGALWIESEVKNEQIIILKTRSCRLVAPFTLDINIKTFEKVIVGTVVNFL